MKGRIKRFVLRMVRPPHENPKSWDDSPLAPEFEAKFVALLKDFAKKRETLVGAPDWRDCDVPERRARLKALALALQQREAELAADYYARERARGASAPRPERLKS